MHRATAFALLLGGCNTFGEGDIEVELGADGVAMAGLSTVDGWQVDFSK